MRYSYYTADVFTDQIFGGNQLAVFPDATGLNPEQMQQVTREFNFSETAFVFPPQQSDNTRLVRIFTPDAEVPFAGHPTLGTAHVLADIGEIPLKSETTNIVFEEGVGPVKVRIQARDGQPLFTQLSVAMPPENGPPPPPVGDIAAVLTLNESDISVGKYAPAAMSCGLPFLFVPLKSLQAVQKASLSRDKWQTILSGYWAPHLFLFSSETEWEDTDLHARMFAPGLGVDEDPATGSAAVTLAGYLAGRDDLKTGTLKWVIEQGFEIGRKSVLTIEADKNAGEITDLRVGGPSVTVCRGKMEIPD